MALFAFAIALALLRCFAKDVQADEEEILSLAGPFKGFLEYRGCFKTPSPSDFIKERTDNFNNNNECAHFCSEVGSKFAATSGMKCYCLNVKPAGKDILQECDTRCPDSIVNGKCFGYECCGGKNYVSLYSSKSTQEKDEAKQRSNTGSLNIQGCFDDSVSNILGNTETLKRVDSENTLLRCNKFCLEKGFPVASLRTDHCYCTNILPLRRLYEGVNNTRECKMFCSGIYGQEGKCERDQCCGGEQEDGGHTYTIFISGTVDVLKQLLRRIDTNFFNQPEVLSQKVWGDPRFCPEGWKANKTFCYQLSNEKRSFYDAKTDCERKNAHLFTVQTEEDRIFWNSEINRLKNINSVWVGLTWNENRRRWDWMNGKPAKKGSAPSNNRCPMFAENAVYVKTLNAMAMELPFLSKLQQSTRFAMTGGEPCQTRHHYYCQSYLKLVVRGRNPTSSTSTGASTFQVQSMELASPEHIAETPSDPTAYRNEQLITMEVVDFKEQIKKEMSPSSQFLAGSDVVFRNKDGRSDTKFIYIHTTEASSGVTVTKSSGGSLASSVGTEFETDLFGIAKQTFKASIEASANWESGTERYTSESTTHSYSFEFPVPARCDATITIMKKELPTRTDWRATFYSSGWVDVKVAGRKETVDVARLLKNTQRNLYSFGTNDFGNRPTIVPVKTLDCIGQEETKQEMEKCKNSKSGKTENCKVQLKPAKTRKVGK